jgi:hypothetical protein
MQPIEPDPAPQAPLQTVAPAPFPAPVAPRPPRPDRRWLRPLAATAVIFLVLTVASSAIVLLPGGGSWSRVQAGSPESIVVSWWQAEQAGSMTAADSYLTSNAQGSGAAEMFTMIAGPKSSLTIQSSSINGDRATVQTTLTPDMGTNGLPGIATDLPMTFTLVIEDGGWKIDDIQPGQDF